MLIAIYLGAIVAANLLVAEFGPGISIFNAFVFIGLDLTTRDRLHDEWGGRRLAWKMLALIAAGGLISYALNRDAGRIALASSIAFMAAAAADAAVYAWRLHRPWLWRANESNIAGAAVDSLAFPAIAFGFPLLWGIVVGQFVAKLAGGAFWSLVIATHRARCWWCGEGWNREQGFVWGNYHRDCLERVRAR